MSVFVVLALLWLAVLVPPVLRARAERRAEFIDSFSRQMGTLGRKTSGGPGSHLHAVPAGRAKPPAGNLFNRPMNPAKRRRDVLGGLLGAIIGSLVLGFIPSLRSVWIQFLFLVNLFIAYVALLAHNRRHVRMAREAAATRHEPTLYPAFDTSH